jgi:spore maturation protein CgeB
MKIVILGLSITSSWGNGHATTYRSLIRGLEQRGHDVLFLEREVPWYAAHRDAPGAGVLYASVDDLRDRFADEIRRADLVVQGSYVPDGVAVADWVLETAEGATSFYDIDTPVTLAKLERGDQEYLSAELVPRFDLYLSFTGGPTLERLEGEFGARRPRPLYCTVDPGVYFPCGAPRRYALGYLGTYSADRQTALERLLVAPASRLTTRRFVVAGPEYPAFDWPANVDRVEHVPASEHRSFYATQAFTLNVTREAMVRAGWSPSVRLFEAGACGVPVISDWWEGLDAFFRPGEEIFGAHDADDVVRALSDVSPDERRQVGERARQRVLAEHTPERRAEQLEAYVEEVAAVSA